MVYMSLMLVLVAVAIVVLLGMAAAGLVHKERALDAHMHEPDTPTVLYLVPPGVDPALVATALAAAGFPAVLEEHEGASALLIECASHEQPQVRNVIEQVYIDEYAPALLLPPVTFTAAT